MEKLNFKQLSSVGDGIAELKDNQHVLVITVVDEKDQYRVNGKLDAQPKQMAHALADVLDRNPALKINLLSLMWGDIQARKKVENQKANN